MIYKYFNYFIRYKDNLAIPNQIEILNSWFLTDPTSIDFDHLIRAKFGCKLAEKSPIQPWVYEWQYYLHPIWLIGRNPMTEDQITTAILKGLMG